MQIYRVEKTDMMGFPIDEQFFISDEKATEHFDKELEGYKESEYLASDDEAHEHNIAKEAISIKNNAPNSLKEALVTLWHRCSHENDEWDVTVEHLKLESVAVKE